MTHIYAYVRAKSLQSCPTLSNSVDCSPPDSSVQGQEYWSGLPYPPLGDLPDPGIKPVSLMSPALAGGFLALAPPGKLIYIYTYFYSFLGFLSFIGYYKILNIVPNAIW